MFWFWSSANTTYSLEQSHAKRTLKMVACTDEELEYNPELMRKEIKEVHDEIRPFWIKRADVITSRIHNRKKFKDVKQAIDQLCIDTLAGCTNRIFVTLSILVEYINAAKDTKFSRSYTYALSRLAWLVSVDPVKSVIQDVVKMQIFDVFDHFVRNKALAYHKCACCKEDKIVCRSIYYTIFLQKHSYIISEICCKFGPIADALRK